MTKVKSSSGGGGNHYRKLSLWINPANHFWERDLYTEKAKEYYRLWVHNMLQDEKRSYVISVK